MEIEFSPEQLEIIRKYEMMVLKKKGYSYSELEQEIRFSLASIDMLINRFLDCGDILEDHHWNFGRREKLSTEKKI